MGIVEEKEQLRKTRRKEMEQEGGTRRKEGVEGREPRKKDGEVKKRRQKQKLEKVLVEEEILCQGPLIVTKVLFPPESFYMKVIKMYLCLPTFWGGVFCCLKTFICRHFSLSAFASSSPRQPSFSPTTKKKILLP